ncbi:hypothetical protein GCM10020367_22270 [Streptomyces sannanensis]|uniref:Uncharacterized protein n=1 Tax=Streptomyces sannanensis TaxID=285536 RepID=A0ABP6S9R0_9ACTN
MVFDESFVRAAPFQEFSAQERMREHARAVRSRPAWSVRRSSKQALILVLLLVLAFGTAIYMGVRHPYQSASALRTEPLRTTVVPLAPRDRVPGDKPSELFAHSPAAHFRTGAAGITMPPTGRTVHFSDSQVGTALDIAKDYLVKSSLAPDVLAGTSVHSVRVLIDPDQQAQFDRSVRTPSDDGRHSISGWLVRLAPAAVLADPDVRVSGTFRFSEIDSGTIDVVSDHTFSYTLRPAGPAAKADGASLFTVRRELHFRFDRDDLRTHRAELLVSYVQAGPLACSSDTSVGFQPLLAGEKASGKGPAGTDPYAVGSPTAALCGTLDPSAQPSR